jgi:hypothetical protein
MAGAAGNSWAIALNPERGRVAHLLRQLFEEPAPLGVAG